MKNKIVVAACDDYSLLAAVWESAVKATHDFLSDEDFEYYKSHIKSYFEQVTLYVYKDTDGTPTGFIGVSGDKVEMLFVDAAYRGNGIGNALLTFAVENLGACKVDVNEQNSQAVGFYIRMGFVVVDRSPYDGDGKNYPLLHMQIKNIV